MMHCSLLTMMRSMSGTFRGFECPICHLILPNDIEEVLLEEHVNSHFNLNCPMCGEPFKQEDHKKYAAHVHTHFQD